MKTEAAKVAWTVEEWRRATGLGATKIWELIREESIDARLVGKRRLILTPPLDYLKSLPRAREAA